MGGDSAAPEPRPDRQILPLYFQAEARIVELVESQQISKCTAVAYLYSQLFELHGNASGTPNRLALLLFTHGPSVTSQGAAVNAEIDALFGRLPQRPRPLPDFASNDRRFQEQKSQLLRHRPETHPRPLWLSTHGTHTDAGPHQGWKEGYMQRDYDRTGRHDHTLFNAFISDHFEGQAFMKTPGATALFERQIRRREEALELRHISKLLFQWFSNPGSSLYMKEDIKIALADPQAVNSALKSHFTIIEKLQKDGYQAAVLSRPIDEKSDVFENASPAQQKLFHQKSGIERFLMSQTDIRANRIGRELSHHLRDKDFESSQQLNTWLHENLCDETLALKHGLVQKAGPFYQE